MDLSVSTWVWLALVVVLAGVEAATVGLVCIWFAIGAAAALIVSAFVDSLTVQIAVFLLVSFAALALTRPLIKKHRLDRPTPTNADRNVGRLATVIVAAAPEELGRVTLDGVDWSARCAQPLAVGERCVVLAVDGATLTVRPENAASELAHPEAALTH